MRDFHFLRAATFSLVATTAAFAQQSAKSSFDRSVIPKAAPDPTAKIPTWSKATLSNGAQLYVVERHSLPMVEFSMNFIGGSNQLEPADKTGLGSLTANMMTEGTATRSGDDISNALQMLGTNVSFSIRGEGGAIFFLTLKDKLEPTLTI